MRVSTLVIALAALSGGAGCSSKSPAPADTSDAATGDGGDIVNCDDPREQAYAPNLQVKGTGGVFTFVLVSSTPAPPADENNVWVLEVLDANGQPVTGATLSSVTPTMPLMSHGTSIPTIAANGDGTFNVSNVYLFMPGLWQVAVTAKNGTQQDSASFFFCVSG